MGWGDCGCSVRLIGLLRRVIASGVVEQEGGRQQGEPLRDDPGGPREPKLLVACAAHDQGCWREAQQNQ